METQRILVTCRCRIHRYQPCEPTAIAGDSVIVADLYDTERDSYIRADVRNYRHLERISIHTVESADHHLNGNSLVIPAYEEVTLGSVVLQALQDL